MKKLIFLFLLSPVLLFAGSQEIKGYITQTITFPTTVSDSGETVSRTFKIKNFKFFGYQIDILDQDSIDIDSVVVEVGLVNDSVRIIRASDKDNSVTWALLFTSLSDSSTALRTIQPPPSNFMRFRYFTGAGHGTNRIIDSIVELKP